MKIKLLLFALLYHSTCLSEGWKWEITHNGTVSQTGSASITNYEEENKIPGVLFFNGTSPQAYKFGGFFYNEENGEKAFRVRYFEANYMKIYTECIGAPVYKRRCWI